MAKKYAKGLLKPEHVESFRLYLQGMGYPVRDGKGEYQVLQVQVCAPGWAIIAKDKNGVLSNDPALTPLIKNANMLHVEIDRIFAKPKAAPALKMAPIKTDPFIQDLRDDFAIAALGMLAHRLGSNFRDIPWDAAKVASASYELADAMLEARKSTN